MAVDNRAATALLNPSLTDTADVTGPITSSTAARTRRHKWSEVPQPHGLKNLLRHDHLFGSIACGSRSERDANRIAYAFLQQNRHSRSRSDYAFASHPRFRESQMKRVIAACGQIAIYRYQILNL